MHVKHQDWERREEEKSEIILSALVYNNAGIKSSRVSVQTRHTHTHFTLHDVQNMHGEAFSEEIKYLREKHALSVSLMVDFDMQKTLLSPSLCLFVYACDIMAALYLLQLDKADNDRALKKNAFH